MRILGGIATSTAVSEGIRRGTDALAGNEPQDPLAAQNPAARVAARHRAAAPAAPPPRTGVNLMDAGVAALERQRSVHPVAEGAVEGAYARSEFLRRAAADPMRVPAAMGRGVEAVQHGVQFARQGSAAQAADVAGAAVDTVRDMDPVAAAGTALRTGVGAADPAQRERLAATARGAVEDTGTRMASQVGTGMLTSALLRRVPYVGPAAAAFNAASTIGGALMSASDAVDGAGGPGGAALGHLEERVAARHAPRQ